MQSEFLGNMAHTMDAKGRATIPAAYREALGPSFYIGMNTAFSAVALYTSEKWDSMRQWLDAFPSADARAMNYARLIKANMFSGETDAQGRVLISHHAAHAGRPGQGDPLCGNGAISGNLG